MSARNRSYLARLQKLERVIQPEVHMFVMWDDSNLHEDYESPAREERIAQFKKENGVAPTDLLLVVSWLDPQPGVAHAK